MQFFILIERRFDTDLGQYHLSPYLIHYSKFYELVNWLILVAMYTALVLFSLSVVGSLVLKPRLSRRSVALSLQQSGNFDLLLNTPILLHKLSPAFVSRYSCFFLDQFGVLHDGTSAVKGAIAFVKLLRSLNKTVIIVSNTSQRQHVAIERFKRLGFDDVSFVLTSGEFAYHHIKALSTDNNNDNTNDNDGSGNGGKEKIALLFGWSTDLEGSYLEGTGFTQYQLNHDLNTISLTMIETILDQVDLIVFQGSETFCGTIIDFKNTGQLPTIVQSILRSCASKAIPAVCCNMDERAVHAGIAHYMPGLFMKLYQTMGGSVQGFGKPDTRFFEAACVYAEMDEKEEMKSRVYDNNGGLGVGGNHPVYLRAYDSYSSTPPTTSSTSGGSTPSLQQQAQQRIANNITQNKKRRYIHVGDSLAHDIEGAMGSGVDAILVTGHGVHRKDFYYDDESRNGNGYSNNNDDGKGKGSNTNESRDGDDGNAVLLHKVCDYVDSKGYSRPTYVMESILAADADDPWGVV